MPELCRFMGIVIRMYRNEHPPAHFHAIHGEHEATYGLDGIPLQGELPRNRTSSSANGLRCIARSSKPAGIEPVATMTSVRSNR